MPNFEIDFDYNMPEAGLINVVADDVDHAENVGMAEIKALYPDITDIKITAVREITS